MMKGQILWSGTMHLKPRRASMRRRIVFVWRHRRRIGLRHGWYILRHGVGGMRSEDGCGTWFV